MTDDAPEACGRLSYDDWLTPCELTKGHLCMHAARNAVGPEREKCWFNQPQGAQASGVPYGVMQPAANFAPLEASWPWFGVSR